MITRYYHNGRTEAKSGKKGPYVSPDYEGYQCPVTDTWIEGRYAHRENLKRTGCRILEKGERRDAPKKVQESFEGRLSAILDKSL